MIPTALQEKGKEIAAKSKELHDIMEKAKNSEGAYVMDEALRADVQKRNTELNDLGKAFDSEREVYEIAEANAKRAEMLREPANALPHQTDEKGTLYDRDGNIRSMKSQKSLGELFTDSEEFKTFRKEAGAQGAKMSVEIEAPQMKTLLDTTTGWVPQAPVPTLVIPYPRRRLVVTDLMPNVTIGYPIVTWFEQTTDTNSAASTAQSAPKPESAVAWTPRQTQVIKIADSIPVTTETLQDIPQAQNEINGTLTYHIMFAEEAESLNGDGTAGVHLLGFTQLPNILSQVRTSGTDSNGDTDNNVDAIFKLFTKIRYTGTGTVFAEPSGVVLHPTNWQTIRLMKTTDGAYIWGPPSESGEERVWGKPVVITPAMTLNTGLTGDFVGYARFFRYKSIQISAGWINDQFIKNQKTILAEERVAQAVLKQQAFGLATALN